MRIAPAKRKGSFAGKAARGGGMGLGSATALLANLGRVSWCPRVSVSQLGMLLRCSASFAALVRVGTSARWCSNSKRMRWGGGRRDTALLARLKFERWAGTAALLLQPAQIAPSSSGFPRAGRVSQAGCRGSACASLCLPNPPKPCRSIVACQRGALCRNQHHF